MSRRARAARRGALPLLLCLAACAPRDAADLSMREGRALLAAGAVEEAASAFGGAAVLRPDDAAAHAAHGAALLRLRRLGQAETALRRATEIDPELGAAWRDLGRILLETGRPAEAARVLRRAYALGRGRDAAIREDLIRAVEASPASL